jgi:hypothetical protein
MTFIPIFASLNPEAWPIYINPFRDILRLEVVQWTWAEKLPVEAQKELKLVQNLAVVPRDFSFLGLQHRLERFEGLKKLIFRKDGWFVKDAKFEFEKVFSKWWSGHIPSKNKESTRKGGKGSKITSLNVIITNVNQNSSPKSPIPLVRV